MASLRAPRRDTELASDEPASLRLQGDQVLAPRQHETRPSATMFNSMMVSRITASFLETNWVNINIPRALDRKASISSSQQSCNDFIAAHQVVPRNDLASFGIDGLLLQAVARLPIDAVEASLSH
jgi:hypothetical protein